jgi:hypothetical protein
VSREQLPYMSDEQFNSIAFVYRSRADGVRVGGLTDAKYYEDHIATLDSFRWIECLLRNNSRERNKQIKLILK